MATCSDLDRLLECPICMESYTNPRMLPCIHSFCHDCLSKYIKSSTDGWCMYCPVCKAQYSVPIDGASGFKKNFLISNIQEAATMSKFNKRPICSSEECANIATVYCKDGCEHLCSSCVRVHNGMKVTSKHNVISLEDTKGEMAMSEQACSKPVFCEKHPGERVRLYCRDCKSCGCSTCLLVGHRNHDICDLSEQAAASRQELRDMIQQVEYYISEVEQQVESTLQHKQQAQADVDMMKTQIVEVIDTLHEKLEQRRSALFEKLQDIQVRTNKVLFVIEDSQNLSIASLKSFACYSHNLLRRGSDLNINEQLQAAKNRSKELQTQPIPTFGWNSDSRQESQPDVLIGDVELVESKDSTHSAVSLADSSREGLGLATRVCQGEWHSGVSELAGPRVLHVCLEDRKRQIRGLAVYGGCLWLVQAGSDSFSVFSSPDAIPRQVLTVDGLKDPTALTVFTQVSGPLVISDWRNGDNYLLHWVSVEPTSCGGHTWTITGHRRQKLTYVPRGLSVTADNVLLVGNNYKHSVYMYDIKGRLLKQLQFGRDVWPYTVLSDPLSPGFVMVDSDHITWVTKHGTVAHRYQPHCDFAPRDIAFDGKDAFYVADYKGNTVERLGSDGNHKDYLLDADSAVHCPTNVCIDRDGGCVYVGHKMKQGEYELLRVTKDYSLPLDMTQFTLNFTISSM